ncbi:MAG: hypothetical protein Rhirs2KO_25150 [Rhizobiaceae bacterium]
MKYGAFLKSTVIAVGVTFAGAAFAQTNWDLPTPYPDGNFHTRNIAQFAEEVGEKSGGSLTITVHAGQSLIKHPDIKNSVRDGIVPAGELLVSRLENESAIFGVDSVPFLASSYEAPRNSTMRSGLISRSCLQSRGCSFCFRCRGRRRASTPRRK